MNHALPLSVRLREGTKDAHRQAEHSPFIQDIFTGKVSADKYREFLVQLLYIYEALEEQQIRHRDHPVIRQIYFPELFRKDSLQRDLSFYFEDGQWKNLSPAPATMDYVQHIKHLSDQWIEGLVAHCYTRYLGDLSGGQVLKGILARTFKLVNGDGLAFYDFPEIEDHTAFKNQYRSRLDVLPLDEQMAEKLVAEANQAFTLNRAVFDAMKQNS